MIKNITLFILCMFLSTLAIGQTQLQGKVAEEATGEAVLFGTVALYKEGVLVTGTETDFDGNYFFSDIDPGTYDVEVTYVGLQTQRITGVVCKAGKVTPLNFQMKEEGVLMDQVEIVGYKVPLIEFDNTTSGTTLTSENIQALPTKNISSIAATSAGVSVNQDGNISIRGSRTDATFYYIDGIRVSAANAGNMIPQAQIEQLQVITGGIEAAYGDVTGGVISITSKGPSNRFTGGVEAETSEFLDAYGYNLINANVSGPIIRKTLEDGSYQSVLGFRAFGQYRHVKDDDPSAVGVYRASEELIRELEREPIKLIEGVPFAAAQFLTKEDIGAPMKTRPNEADRDFNVGLNLDARISDAMNLSLSSAYYDSKNQFTPGTISGRRVSMFNWVNNPYDERYGYRGSVRFRHKLGRQSIDMDDEDKNSLIRNASYTLQFGYEKINRLREDQRHQDNFFNYGYYGNQNVDYQNNLSEVTDPDWTGPVVIIDTPAGPRPFAFQGVTEQDGEFTPGDINPVLAHEYDTGEYYNNLNGFREQAPRNIFNVFENVGSVYNAYSKQEEDRYTINVNSGFDLFPGGSESGKHSIQFGFMYEQRIQRSWGISPRAIWQLMRGTVNRHIINGINTNEIIGDSTVLGTNLPIYAPNNQEAEFSQNKFFRAVREELGVTNIDFVNVDGIDPSRLRLDMFAPGELIGEAAIGLNYYGYDYLGNKISGASSFDDFFSATDENGRRRFNVAPFQPNYMAGYIQDKFTFKDIIFRLGVRVDYYDANTKVLIDPYSFSEIESADQFFSRGENAELVRPGAVGDDYKVYVKSDESNEVVAYRQGDQWFDANGTATNANLLFVQGQVFPSYTEKNVLKRNPQYYESADERFDPNNSFKDYDPQLNVMPRLAFSFPISESAGFFAHYDVLVQRPQAGAVISTPLNYYFFNNTTRFSSQANPAENPDLKPQRTIDYEVGFQQKVSNSSAIKMSAYYRELRDMIQRRIYNNVPNVNRYETYGNLDFGTVKGFSFSYDLRRTKNFQLNATYTLQFADGTGSDLNSSQGLNANQDIRALLPLSYDERHRFTAVADYRFASGSKYDGPRIAGKDILADLGVNLLLTTISGRPYSTFQAIDGPVSSTITESINKTRLPWQFNADLQVDKNFSLSFSEESTRKLNVNVYLRVTNLFDLDNVVRVYNFTQSPEDSGWLNDPEGQTTRDGFVRLGFTEENYNSAIDWRLLQPNFYARPRQIFLGAIVNF